jgi:1,4-dihydroxy-2-naphthoate octaprenyltransferase
VAAVGAAAAPSALRAWWLAARPRTQPLALAPVLVGTAVAWSEGAARAWPALAALAGALWLQIGANFANDVFDAERGADTAERVGPARAVQQGWLSARAVRTATGVAFAVAALFGLYLIAVGGWPIAVLGVLSILAGFAYTGGPYPLGYHGLGEVMVFLFFGLGAVCGTTFVQTLDVPAAALLASVPVGALAAAVLVVNNTRDIDTDRAAGKRTLAVRFGDGLARRGYVALVVGSFAIPVAWAAASRAPAILIPLVCTPLAARLCRSVLHDAGARLNATLAGTAQLAVLFATLLALGIALS